MPTTAQLFEYGLFAIFAYLLPGHPTLSATADYFEQRKKGTQTHSGFILAGPSYLNVWTFGFVVSILYQYIFFNHSQNSYAFDRMWYLVNQAFRTSPVRLIASQQINLNLQTKCKDSAGTIIMN